MRIYLRQAPRSSAIGRVATSPRMTLLADASYPSRLPLSQYGGRNRDDLPVPGATDLGEISLAPLPFSRLEAELIRRYAEGVHVEVFTGDSACETEIMRQTGENAPDLLHIASHAVVLNDAPKASGIALAPCSGTDGYLTVSEIAQLDLPLRLAVLSCCNTALGRLYRGEGMDGICRAFFLAGTQALVVSLWSIADEPSALLMGNFYSYLFKSGLDPAKALARAKRDFIRSPRYCHPFFWAPFVYVGGPARPFSHLASE